MQAEYLPFLVRRYENAYGAVRHLMSHIDVNSYTRKRGSISRRFTASEVREQSEELTAIGLTLLQETRGRSDLYPMRKSVARHVRRLREINWHYSNLAGRAA